MALPRVLLRGMSLIPAALILVGLQMAPAIAAQASAPVLHLAAADQPSESAATMSEADAFAAAKELNTIDGWQAFLKHYPSGFRADLARAYVEKLQGAGSPPPPAPVVAPPPAAPPPAPVVAAPPPALPTVDLGQAASAWGTTTYPIDTNQTVEAATVQANGIQMLAYCDARKKAFLLLRANPAAAYPDFEQRVTQGLGTEIGVGATPHDKRIGISFSNGASADGTAWRWPSGEIAIGDPTDPYGFPPDGAIMHDLMSESWVRFSAPPFQSTIQLTGSRDAICRAFAACSVTPPGCPSRSQPASTGAAAAKPGGCAKGQIKLEGRCIAKRDAAGFCGPGYRPSHGKCVHGAYQAPAKPHTSHGCAPGLVWSAQEGCHEDD
jgi:hypothetical protein